MIITKRYLPRRTVLRGLGATLALPLLDGMVPALAPLRATAAQPVRRLGAIYVPNGVEMRAWTPTAQGTTLELSSILEPLAPVRDQVCVLSGLADKPAIPREGEGVGDHARAAATWLTAVHAKKTEGPDIRAGVSMDQIAARELGKETQLASLELAIDSVEVLGACDQGYSCAYANTIAWRNPTTPLPMENNPRAVFERLFGAADSTDAAARLARRRQDRSILDFVTGEATQLGRRLGAGDRRKIDQYLDAVRDVERRIQKAEEQSDREIPVVEQPIGIPGTFETHARLMFDLLTLAYQTDLTRVSTFMFGREVSGRSFPEIGVPGGHHGYSHHQNDPENLAMLAKINTHHIAQFGYFLEKLRATPDGDGSLLDHSLLVYGAGISDGNLHFHLDLPTLLAGGGAGHLKGGRHLEYPRETPLANLHVTVLDKLGIPVEQFGDSTGQLDYLSDV
ncbi:MAG: DUF1552 domain-containing protein [Vicinamibacterales bacterium]|jgi:hypothetical protein|nr:DUF1552 domain-containing protein [Vicinamibacterales bacterium]